MLNRRHLRIKVLQSLYAFYQCKSEDVDNVEKNLFNSLEKIYDLYIYLLLTFSELKKYGLHRMEESKKKIILTDEDINPNKKFVENELINIIENDVNLISLSKERKLNWSGDVNQQMFRKIYNEVIKSDIYNHYMNNGIDGFEEDKKFLIELFKSDIANSNVLYDYFNDKNISWVDDLDLVCSMIVKTINSYEKGNKFEIFNLYKENDDEKAFVSELLLKTILFDKANETLIDDLTLNWEFDRIAKMDVILMKMAITELQVFDNIPIKVTLNEYIEISKYYSTPKSNIFINGILDKAILSLSKENKLNKVGLGLKN